ncbi:MAG: nitroreductase [Promethearchaeota archaeon]|nr:MAG: nitroreductase [Candidatus Lokiarchaeota archaeon]
MNHLDFEEVIYRRRTIRRFKQKEVKIDILKKLVDYARVAPSGNNIQSIEYILIRDPSMRKKIFPLLSWAASLPKDKRTPEPRRRPTSYIIVLVNKTIKKNADLEVGAAIENILLGATNSNLGCCWMGAIDRPKIREILEIPDYYDIKNVISIGYPDEISVIEPFKDSLKYWKDEEGKMHVPKRSLDDLILKIV